MALHHAERTWDWLQMISISLLLLGSGGQQGVLIQWSTIAGPPLLCGAALLTMWSLADYMRQLWPYM